MENNTLEEKLNAKASMDGFVKKDGLRDKLLRSHMTIAAIGVFVLVIALGTILNLRSNTLRLSVLRGPTTQASLKTLSGVQQTLAGLRGWMALGKTKFKVERRTAWAEEIGPSLLKLNELNKDWTNPENNKRLEKIIKELKQLEEAQWWIEDVAQTPGNEPARVILLKDIEPIAQSVISASLALIGLEKKLEESSRRKFILGVMADFRGFFTRSLAFLNNFVATGDVVAERGFREHLKVSKKNLETIKNNSTMLNKEQIEFVSWLDDEFKAYERIGDEVIRIRKSQQWNVAQYKLAEFAVPHAEKSIDLLREMSNDQAELMYDDGLLVTRISNMVVVILILLIVGMIFVAYYVSNRNAQRLIKPLGILSESSVKLAEGKLKSDIPVISDDEIGELTMSFNKMRRTIEKRDQRVRLSTEQLKKRTDTIARTKNVMVNLMAEMKEQQAQLKDQKFALDQHSIVAITDVSGKITYANDKFCEISKFSMEELLGQDHRIINSGYHPKEFMKELWHMIANGKVWKNEIKNKAKDGSYYWVDTTIVPFMNKEGKPYQYLAIRTDITARKEAEQQIQEKAKELQRSNEDLEQFAYVASHDLQEPLRMVASYTHLLERRYKDKLDDKANEFIRFSVDGAKRMQSLINDLLSYSRVGTQGQKFEQVEMEHILDDALKNLEVSIQEKMVTIHRDKLPSINGDSTQLVQLLQNLIGNGIKFCQDKKPEISVSAAEKNGQWCFSIQDNGIGIDKKYQDRIFVIFQRLHTREEYQGTGIGLAVCRKIVERHGGKIWVDSKAGKGTTFYFTIPKTGGV